MFCDRTIFDDLKIVFQFLKYLKKKIRNAMLPKYNITIVLRNFKIKNFLMCRLINNLKLCLDSLITLSNSYYFHSIVKLII